MNKGDREEIRIMITGALAPLVTKIDGRDVLMNATLNNMDARLDRIDKHLEKLNGRVAEHEKVVNMIGEDRIKGCVQTKVIQEPRDNIISRRGIRNAIVAGISIGTAMIGVIIGLIQLL